jgi:hypothetical protein
MRMPRALLFSCACHLFCFSFLSFRFDIQTADLSDKFSMSFLGSILDNAEPSSWVNRLASGNDLPFTKDQFPKESLSINKNKPPSSLMGISIQRHLNKFLVFEKRLVSPEKQTAQDKYLNTKPSWDRVDLKLRIE